MGLPPLLADAAPLADRNDRVQLVARCLKHCRRDLFPRVRPGTAHAPVEGLRLVREHVALFALRADVLHRERVRLVRDGMRHRQADDKAGLLVEGLCGQDKHRVFVLHFAAHLRTEVDPDHVASIGHPKFADRRHQNTSAPTRPVAITSPPCTCGSNALSFCASVSFGLPAGRKNTPPSTTSTVIGVPRASRAARATGDVMRTPRPLPPSCTVNSTFTIGSMLDSCRLVETSINKMLACCNRECSKAGGIQAATRWSSSRNQATFSGIGSSDCALHSRSFAV